MKLTKSLIDKLQPSEKATNSRPDKHTDGNGLQLLVRVTGTKTWLASYNWNGKNQNITIGRYPSISLREARQCNNEIRQLLHKGINPKDKLQEDKRKLNGDYLFKAYAKKYHDLQGKKVKPTTYNAMISLYERRISPVLGDTPVTDITPLDVLKVAQKTAKKSGNDQARRAVRQINRIMTLAVIEGLITINPANDVTMLLPTTNTEHRARIDAGELQQLLNDIDNYNGHKGVKTGLKLLAHTFTRVSELVTAEWQDIDFDKEQWVIPDYKMKMNKPHIVPLSPQVISMLKDLQASNGNSKYVLHNTATGKHYTRASLTTALHNMGYKGIMTSHGFRGLASTTLHEQGYKHEVIELQLAHVTGNQVSRAYNHSKQLLLRRKMMNDWSKFLDKSQTQTTNDTTSFKAGEYQEIAL